MMRSSGRTRSSPRVSTAVLLLLAGGLVPHATSVRAADLRSLIGTGTQSEEELKKETRLGVHVEEVDPAGAAHAAGLRGGDLILGVNGYRVAGASEVRYVIHIDARSINIGLSEPIRVLTMPGQGKTVSMLVNRQGELQTLSVTVRGDGALGYLGSDPAVRVDSMLKEAALEFSPKERAVLAQMPERALLMMDEWRRQKPGALSGAVWFAEFLRLYLAVRLGDFDAATKPPPDAPIPFVRSLASLYVRIAADRKSGRDATDPDALGVTPRFLVLYYPFPLPAAPPVDCWTGSLRTADPSFAVAMRASIENPATAAQAASRYLDRPAAGMIDRQLDELRAACLAPGRHAQLPHASESICPEHHPDSLNHFQQWTPTADHPERTLMRAARVTAGLRVGNAGYLRGQMVADLRAVNDECPWMLRTLLGGTTRDAFTRTAMVIPGIPADWADDLARRDAFWRTLLHRAKGRIDCFREWTEDPPVGIHRDAWALATCLLRNPSLAEPWFAPVKGGMSENGQPIRQPAPVARETPVPSSPAPSPAELEDSFSAVPWMRERLIETAAVGVQVASVLDNSPASRAGLRPGDVILGVCGVRVVGEDEVRFARGLMPMRSPDLLVARAGGLVRLPVSADPASELGFRGPDRDAMVEGVIRASGIHVAPYERALLGQIPDRALVLVRRWLDAHPDNVKDAAWLADFLRLSIAVRSPDPAKGLRPLTPAPIPFVNVLAGLYSRVAGLRADGSGALDAARLRVPARLLQYCFPYPLPPSTADAMLGAFKTEDAEFLRLFRARLADPVASRQACVSAARIYADGAAGAFDARVIRHLKAACLDPAAHAAFAFGRRNGLLVDVEGLHALEAFDPAETNAPEASLRLAAAVASWTWSGAEDKEVRYKSQIRDLLARTPALGRLTVAYAESLQGNVPVSILAALEASDALWKEMLGRIKKPRGYSSPADDLRTCKFEYYVEFRDGAFPPAVDLDAWAIGEFIRKRPPLADRVFLNIGGIPQRAEEEFAL